MKLMQCTFISRSATNLQLWSTSQLNRNFHPEDEFKKDRSFSQSFEKRSRFSPREEGKGGGDNAIIQEPF